jgi:predicted NBD/HSP70 family sugar kinase
MGQGSNSSALRNYNERIVISTLRKNGSASKADLARAMGLTLPTLSRIIDDLESRELITKTGRRSHGVGQPSNIYHINPNCLYSIGIKLGRQNLEFVLTNFSGDIIHKQSTDFNQPTPEMLVDVIQSGIITLTNKLTPDQLKRFAGIGFGMPWFIGSWVENNEMDEEHALLWQNFDLAFHLENQFDYDIFYENDCTAAAAAELYFGTDETSNNFLYVFIGSFIGGGLILNGDLEKGVHSNAACLATMPVPKSTLNNSNAGENWTTLVERASLTSLIKYLNYHKVNIVQISELPSIIDDNRSLVHDWMLDCADSLAFAIYSSISILDLEKVVIDSDLPRYLLTELITIVDRKLQNSKKKYDFLPKLQQGTLGEDAIAIGGAFLPIYFHFAPDKTVILKGGIPDRSVN